MAARTNKVRHDADVRNKIKAGVIIQRLTKHIESAKPILDASQVSAAKVLLNKVLPDLKAMEVTGKDGGPVQHEVSPSDKLKAFLEKASANAKSG